MTNRERWRRWLVASFGEEEAARLLQLEADGLLAVGAVGAEAGTEEAERYEVPLIPCEGCGVPLNPVAVMLGATCGRCVRLAHRQAVQGTWRL